MLDDKYCYVNKIFHAFIVVAHIDSIPNKQLDSLIETKECAIDAYHLT